MKETTKNTLNDLKKFGVAAVLLVGFVLVALTETFWVIPYGAVAGYLGGYLAAKSSKGTASWKDGLLWGAIGLAAGIGAFIAI